MGSARASVGIILTLVLLAVPGAAAGQTADEAPADGSEDTAPMHVTWSGAMVSNFPAGMPKDEFPWGPREYAGFTVTHVSEDPRISGEWTEVVVYDGPLWAPSGESIRATSVVRLENDEGAWQGPVTTVVFPDRMQVSYGWLTGEGAYEGLSYFTSYHDDTASDIHKGQGMIWPGDPPSMPDPALLEEALAR